MRQVPKVELELMLAAASMSERSENFHRLARDAGLALQPGQGGTHFMEALAL